MKKVLLYMFLVISFVTSAQQDPGTILSVNPNTASRGQRLQVTITGGDTRFTQVSDTYNVSFYNNLWQQFVINAIDMVSDTVLVADVTIPGSNAIGTYNLSVDLWTGGAFLANAFTVTNYYNTISGNVGIDVNGNGCDAADLRMSGIKVNLNDGTADSVTFTDSLGNYIFYVPRGNYVVTPQFEGLHYAALPPSATVNFETENSLSHIQNFCLLPNGVSNDVDVDIVPIGPARPGFNATYRLVYKNKGNQTVAGAVNFTFDDTRLDFVSITATPASQTANNINWDYTNLLPFESRAIDITLNVNSPMETPPVNNNDVLVFNATANPVAGDNTPENNNFTLNQIVVGSYDPNDKAVVEGSEVDISNAGKYLHYLIRFQNSGTYMAENVVVRDLLSSNLDKSSLEVTSASHPYRSSLTAGNKLEFFFDNINLPTEASDEPGSHGFIAFKIKPSSTIGLGSVIENTAQIYFDFNFPIVTNTVSTTYTVLSSRQFDRNDGVLLYPNPAKNTMNIEFQFASETATVKIFNQLGQLVKVLNGIDKQTTIVDVADLKTGTYLVHITSDKGTSVKKLMKY